MAGPLADSLFATLLGSKLAAVASQDNKLSIDGLAWHAVGDGSLEVAARAVEASSLRIEAGAASAQLGRFAAEGLTATVRMDGARVVLQSLKLARTEVSGVRIEAPLDLAATNTGAMPVATLLAPLGGAEGTLRARITDAQLIFDADVTIPIRAGRIHFNDATVEHVGPDSRMGVSRMGFYVDAPNGRSYLYQFASVPVAGVEFERRGAFIGPWVSDRGNVQLQPFAEGLLAQGPRGAGQGITQQARLLLDRTAVSGEVRLGAGRLAAFGLQADVAGDESGGTTVQVRSDAVGRGITAGIASLVLRGLAGTLHGLALTCDEVTGSAGVRLFVQCGQLRFALDAPRLVLSRLQLRQPAAS